MSRSSFALLALAFLAAVPSVAQQYTSSFRGDGFDASLSSHDGCRDIQIYLSGSDYSTRSGPGQPQMSNSLWGYASIFDCETQSWGWTWIDQSDAAIDAKGPNSASTLRGSIEVEYGHYELTGAQTCYTYGGWCWTDWNGNEVCEEAGEYCYDEYVWVVDPSKTLSFDLNLAPSGDAYRGMNMGMSKGPGSMYRYRYTGTQRYGAVTGTLTLDGEDLTGSTMYSWASVWTANSGSVSVYTNN